MENTHNLINNIKKTILITLDDIEKKLLIELNNDQQIDGKFNKYASNLINLNIEFNKFIKFNKNLFKSENKPTKIIIDSLSHIQTHFTKCLNSNRDTEPELILLYEQFERLFDFYIKLASVSNNHNDDELNDFFNFLTNVQSKFKKIISMTDCVFPTKL